MEQNLLFYTNSETITEKCSFIVANVHTEEIRAFNIDALQNPQQRRLVGKKLGDEFDIPNTKIKYKILEILPPNEAPLKLKQSMVSANNQDVNMLIKKLNYHKFEGFIHTTEIENFKSILESGYLYPRNNLIHRKINFKDAAEMGVLEKTENFIKNCCRFYYYYKTPTNYNATIEGKYKNPIIIVFDKTLAYENNVFFCPKNAQQGIKTNSAKKALNYDWEGIFERGDRYMSKYCHGELTEEITREISHIRNAEFLVHGSVSISFIHKIYVSSQTQFDSLKSFCNHEIMKKVEIGRDKFDKIF